MAFGLGKLETTEDILELVGMLGAMGAFDPDKEAPELGEQYGVYRDDFATRDEYVQALNNARFDVSADEEDIDFDDWDLYVICRVSRLDNGDNTNYRSDEDSLHPGDQVLVPDGNGGSAAGIVIAVKTISIEEVGIYRKPQNHQKGVGSIMSNEIIERSEDSLAMYEPEIRVAHVSPAAVGFNAHAVIGHLAQYANLANIAGAIKKGTQYVVQVPTHLQAVLDSGKYTMLHGKESGKTWATIVEKLPSGKNKFIDNCPIVEEAFYHGNPLQEASSSLANLQMQQQMAALAQLMGETYEAILRVESGQKADRIGQLTSGRDGIVHALKMKDSERREQQIVAARQSLLEAQGKIGEVLRQKVASFKGVPRFAVARFAMEVVHSGYLDKQDDAYEAIHEYYDLYIQATQLIAESFLICDETDSAISVFDSCKQFIGRLDFSKLGTVLYAHQKMLKSDLFYHQAANAIAKERTLYLETAKPYDVIEITLDGADIMEVLASGNQEETQ